MKTGTRVKVGDRMGTVTCPNHRGRVAVRMDDTGKTLYTHRSNLRVADVVLEPSDYCGIAGIGGIGLYTENESPIIPSVRVIEQYERMAAHARRCRRCGQTDVFDGVMFTLGDGDICDDCFG